MPTYPTSSFNVFRFSSLGLEYHPSGSIFEPTSSNPSIPQHSVITCSISGTQLDSVNNYVHEVYKTYGSTQISNVYLSICLSTATLPIRNPEGILIGTQEENVFYTFRYATGSMFNVSSSNTQYYSTGSFNDIDRTEFKTILYEVNDTAEQIAYKTYAAFSSSHYYGRWSASISSSNSDHYLFIYNNFSGSVNEHQIYTGSLNPDNNLKLNTSVIQSGSGTFNFRPALNLRNASASFVIKHDPNDHKSIAFTVGSSSFGGDTDRTTYYVSSSGRIGFNTTDPQSEVDFIADDFQVQKPGKRQGIKVNKEGNIESFNNETTAASTGSELIMSYGRGGSTAITKEIMEVFYGGTFETDEEAQNKFNALDSESQNKILYYAELEGYMANQANIGDTLGAIRWVAASGSSDTQDDFNSRTTGEAAKIEAVVNASSKLGVSADLLFKVSDATALDQDEDVISDEAAAPKTMLRLDGFYRHELTGSLNTTSYINSAYLLPGYINQTGTSDNSFAGDIILSNMTKVKGKETGGTGRNMLYMGTNDVVQVGATNTPLSLRSSGIISATGSLSISGSIEASSISTTKITEVWHAGWTMDSITSFINWAGTTEQIGNFPKHFTQRVVPYNATMKKFILRLRQKSGNSGIGNNSIITMYSRSFSDGVITHTTSSVAPTNGEYDLAYSSASFNLNDAPGNYDGLAVLTGSNFSNAITLNQYDGVSFSIKRGDNNADEIQANATIIWEYDITNDYTPSGSHS